MVTAGAFDGERPLHPAGEQVLLAAFERGWADPNGLGAASAQSRHLLNAAREEIAGHLGVTASEIEFWGEPALVSPIALQGASNFRSGKFIVGQTERQEILAVTQDAPTSVQIAVDHAGILDRDQLIEVIESNSTIAIQAANGETGVRQPLSDFSSIVGTMGANLHLDYTASGPLIPLPTYWSTADFPAKSWSGPSGIGIMLINKNQRWAYPFSHATNRRSPESYSLPLVLAAAAALTGWLKDAHQESDRIRNLISMMRQVISRTIPEVDIAGSGNKEESLPHILSISALNISGERLVNALAKEGFAVGSGSACVASAIEPSHVLHAMGILTHGNLRISLMHGVLESDVKRFLALLPGIITQLRSEDGA